MRKFYDGKLHYSGIWLQVSYYVIKSCGMRQNYRTRATCLEGRYDTISPIVPASFLEGMEDVKCAFQTLDKDLVNMYNLFICSVRKRSSACTHIARRA